MDIFVSWLIAERPLGSLQSVFQLSVGLNLVTLGYTEARRGIEARIDAVKHFNDQALKALHHQIDKELIRADGSYPQGAEANANRKLLESKWDTIQLGIVNTRINDSHDSIRKSIEREDSALRMGMVLTAMLSYALLAVSSFDSNLYIPTYIALILVLSLSGLPFYRFGRAFWQAANLEGMIVPRPQLNTEKKFIDRQQMKHRTFENEARKLAKRVGFKEGTFRVDERFQSIESGKEISALYFISGQLRKRLENRGEFAGE